MNSQDYDQDQNPTEAFATLNPDLVFAATESLGFAVTGEMIQLNSFENRVFDIRLEKDSAASAAPAPQESPAEGLIVKFYRPNRWTQAAIQEEHDFLFELEDAEIPAVTPLRDKSGQSLRKFGDFFVGVFPKIRARMPDELRPRDLTRVGSLLGRLHNVSFQKCSEHRMTIGSEYYGGWETLDTLQRWIAPELNSRYTAAATEILHQVEEAFDGREFRRIHGDFHRGNILINQNILQVVDFDDFCNGPAVQDVWMLFSEDPSGSEIEWDHFLQGYQEFRDFSIYEKDWIPLLRALRVMGYAGWIANRWHEESFRKLFPDFNTYRYWAVETESLEKIAWSLHNSSLGE